jgi:hypothetical protein
MPSPTRAETTLIGLSKFVGPLLAAAARASTSTAASRLNSLAAAYSQITIPTARLFINRILVKR